VGLIEGAFSDSIVDMLGREMSTSNVRVRAVMWRVDLGALGFPSRRFFCAIHASSPLRVFAPGLYGCWSYLNAHVAAADYRVRASS
jgi:hypothetical protein